MSLSTKSFYLEKAEELSNKIDIIEDDVIEIALENKESTIIKEESFKNTEHKLKVGDDAPDLSNYKVVASEGDVEDIHSYSSFSGADMVISFDGKVYGEIQSLDYFKVSNILAKSISNCSDYYDRDIVSEYPVVLLVGITLFNKSPEINDGSNITITYANEAGNKAIRSIYNVHQIAITGGMSVDTIINEEYYVLCAENISDLTPVVEGDTNEDTRS